MAKFKTAISLVIQKADGKMLIVRRPDDAIELPGVWGLPATVKKQGESAENAAVRAGMEKLGVKVVPVKLLNQGSQERKDYNLFMEVWECEPLKEEVNINQKKVPVNGTRYVKWKWADSEELEKVADSGSFCCKLYLNVGKK